MNISPALLSVLIGSACWVALPLPAQPLTPTTAVAPAPAVAPAAKPTSKPAPTAKAKASRKKRAKRYSKATLSAFQPLPAAPAATVPAGLAPIALSPVVKPEAAQAIQPREAPVVEAASPLAQPVERAPAFDEDSRLVQHERPVDAPAGESDALGQESVSVIDRFADKPKAQPLTEGPLKVRVKDSGVRASVQIPLDAGK